MGEVCRGSKTLQINNTALHTVGVCRDSGNTQQTSVDTDDMTLEDSSGLRRKIYWGRAGDPHHRGRIFTRYINGIISKTNDWFMKMCMF